MTRTLAALSVASLLLLTACSSDAKTVCDYEDVASTSYAQLSVTLEDLAKATASEEFVADDISGVNSWGAEARTTIDELADTLNKEAALVADESIAAQYVLAEGFLRESVGAIADVASAATSVAEYQEEVLALLDNAEWKSRGDAGEAAFAAVDEYVLQECAAA